MRTQHLISRTTTLTRRGVEASARLARFGYTEATLRARLLPTMSRVRPYSMLHGAGLLQLGDMVETTLRDGVAGDFVECGVWRGGASFLMASMLEQARDSRLVWMFDSFEGLPEPTHLDGTRAQGYLSLPADQTHDRNTASFEDVEQAARDLALTERVRLVKGWFEDTLPKTRAEIGPIALLRIDGDWYESVKCCLENLYDQVAPGGFVVLDDYYYWPGCAVAVHEFLGARQLAHPVHESRGIGYFRKT